jgi:hypothetical protein
MTMNEHEYEEYEPEEYEEENFDYLFPVPIEDEPIPFMFILSVLMYKKGSIRQPWLYHEVECERFEIEADDEHWARRRVLDTAFEEGTFVKSIVVEEKREIQH